MILSHVTWSIVSHEDFHYYVQSNRWTTEVLVPYTMSVIITIKGSNAVLLHP